MSGKSERGFISPYAAAASDGACRFGAETNLPALEAGEALSTASRLCEARIACRAQILLGALWRGQALERGFDRFELGDDLRGHDIAKDAGDRQADDASRRSCTAPSTPAISNAAGAAGLSAAWRRQGGGRLRLQPCSCDLVLGQDLIEARLEPPVGPFAGAQLARPVQRNDVARLVAPAHWKTPGRPRSGRARPGGPGTRGPCARSRNRPRSGNDGRIFKFDLCAALAEIAHDAVERRVAAR